MTGILKNSSYLLWRKAKCFHDRCEGLVTALHVGKWRHSFKLGYEMCMLCLCVWCVYVMFVCGVYVMYVCVVSVHLWCVHVCMYACGVHVYVCTCMCVHIHVWCVCVYVCMYLCVYVCVHV